MASWLHFAYQNHHIEPGVMLGLRTQNDVIPLGERLFMQASDYKAIKEGYTPVKVVNFAGKEEGSGE